MDMKETRVKDAGVRRLDVLIKCIRIKAVAYSATGNLSQSEDLAQETFIAAWKGLQTLREPEKLRSWLCGIARNIIAGAVRSRRQEPAYSAKSLDESVDFPSAESLPEDRAISSEEESILGRSLEHIPQISDLLT